MKSALAIFRALADPTRLRIIGLVRHVELAVGELAQLLGQSQPRVSRHIKILADAGLLRRAKEGAWVFVRLGDAGSTTAVLAVLDALAVDTAADLARLADVRAERGAAAAAYFAAHAAEWDSIRSLHVADSAVEAAIAAAVGGDVGDLLDIGTGTGRIIELFGHHAASATGIDRSPEMLRFARGKLEAAGLPNAEVRLADMYALPRPDASADTVILHQVLHFADAPAAALTEAARTLRPGGRLFVIDFAPHDREDLRERHAHVRLGFGEAQVCGWLVAAGLEAAVVDRLAPPVETVAPLTVTLWRGTRPAVTQIVARKVAA